jgi:hypothetical protein
MTSAAMDNDALQAEMAILQQKQDSLTAELEDNVDMEIDNLRQQLVADGDPFDELDDNQAGAQSQAAALLALPKLPAQQEEAVVKLSAAVVENKHLQDGILASSMAEEQALEQQIETAKSQKHELQRQLSQASEQGARLQSQVEEVSNEENQLVQQQQALVVKQKELLGAIEAAAPAERKALRQQITAIAGETEIVTKQIADASAQRKQLDQEMASAYIALQSTQQEQITVVAIEQAALKQHLDLCTAKEASLALLMENADPTTTVLLQQEAQNAELKAKLINERGEAAALEATQIKNAVASAAAAEERVFRKRMADAGKVILEKQTLNEQMVINAHTEQEILHEQLESAAPEEQDELKEQISRASEAESKAAEALTVDAAAADSEKRALEDGLRACAATTNRVQVTVASAEKHVLVGQRVAAATARKHTCGFMVADSEQVMNDFQSQLITTAEAKNDLERQLEVNGDDESVQIAYADATNACLRAEKWAAHQAQHLKRKEKELAEATSIERKLQRDYVKGAAVPASANNADLERMVRELSQEKEQMMQELERERNAGNQRLQERKIEERALLEEVKASPEAAQHVQQMQQVIEAQSAGTLNILKTGQRSSRPKRKVLNPSDPEDVKQTTVKYAAMDAKMRDLTANLAANPADEALVRERDALEEDMNALEDVMHEWGVHCTASVLSEVVRQLSKPQIGAANSGKRTAWMAQAEVLRKIIAEGGGWNEAIVLENGDVDLNMELDIWSQADQVNILKRMKEFLQETLETQFLSLSSDKDRLKNNMILARNKLQAEKKRGDHLLEELDALRAAPPSPRAATPSTPAEPTVIEKVVVDSHASVENVVRTVEAARELSEFCAAQIQSVLPEGDIEVILGHASLVSQKTDEVASLAQIGDHDEKSMAVLFSECDQLGKAMANTVKETVQELVAAYEERGNAPPIVVDDAEDYASTIAQLKQQLSELGSKVEQYQLDLAASLEKERQLKEAHTASELEKMQLAMKLKDVEGELAKQGVDPNMRIALEYVKEKTTNKLEKVQTQLDDLRLERYYNISDMIESYKFTAPRSVVNVNGVRFKSIADWASQKKKRGKGTQFPRKKRRPRGLARKSDLPPVQGLPCGGAGFGSSAAAAAQMRAERNKQHHSLHTRVFVHSNRQEQASPLASDHAWFVPNSVALFYLLSYTFSHRLQDRWPKF